ncbi:outer membrane protein assembly factor BamE [Thiolapillus sp.]
MRKLLISVALTASLAGCSSIDIDKDTWDLFGNVIPKSLEKLPFVYKPQIIQGNLIVQDNVNQLKPGMHKKQVELVMGTALLQDVFHDNRWDYYYGMGIGTIELEKRLTLYFENDKLVRIVGDYQPLPPLRGEGAPKDPKAIIPVPDWQPAPASLFEKAMTTVGLGDEAEEVMKAQQEKDQERTEAKDLEAMPENKTSPGETE